jgi:hypothetical protein
MTIRFTDADGFDRGAQGADLAVVLVSRQDVESLRIGSTVERLMLFSDCAKHVHQFAGRVVIQVDGYDDDPRALVSIPEVKRFFQAVDGHWSYWLHFLIPEVSQIQLILLMLVDVKKETVQNGHIGFSLTSPQQLEDQIQRLLAAMETLHDAFKVPRAHAELMIAAVVRAMG